ncbi:MAG TPA: polysaccharide biosynthesis tyrosine autokinase [Candidatus Thiothrix moscowensis]|uniref:GumC family protein n=1 Tax=unclassified Thiothrix TaxID=2636184 RepID=UPI0025E3D3F5|nr:MULTISPECIES: polysaccharide biosynthesis tyrosine autokinase [unclassified Thiothrix]HRJ54349.1 polysaccharide biosynthesis tyrosine autokinase [Candidatus Thiothrix moscowensis]HRJ94576.1 polysaccharide biosynthesis tyrosine autokinase [Candidatus Thiothrix moscowensis]
MQQDNRNNLPYRSNQQQRPETKPRDTLDLRDFWKTLVRQQRLIALIAGVTVLLTLLYTLLSANVYRSTTTLQIEREGTTIKFGESDLNNSGDIRDTRDFYQTQFELIRSRALAAKVIETLKLHENTPPSSLIGKIKQWFGSDDPRVKQTVLEEQLIDNLSVEPVKNSRLVAIHYESSSPEQAAQIANAVAATFHAMNMERRSSAATDAQTYLSGSVQEAKNKLEEAEKRLTQYAQEHEIIQIDGKDVTTSSMNVQTFSEKLSQIQQERFDKESKLAVLSDKARPAAERIGILKDNSAYLQTLAQRLDQLKTQKSSTAELRQQIRNLENEIDAEIATKLTSINSELEAIKKEESLVHESIARAKAAAMQEQDKSIAYNTLQREVTTNQELYQSLLQRMKEISVAGGMAANNVVIIDKAQVPLKKFKPSLSTNLAFGTLLGLLLGMSAAFLRDFMDDRVKDVAELERATALPVLGIVPAVQDYTPDQLAMLAVKEPRSSIAESFRSLRTALRFVLQDGSKGIIFVTSAHAGEGKSTTTSNLACAYANAGNKVLLIDADLRNPSLHKTLGITNETGLSNYLEGYGDTTAMVQATGINNLSLIPAGTLPDDPAELISSAQMESLLATARDAYDLILIDGPPVLGLADAVILASLADTTLVTVRAESTHLSTLGNALKRLRQSHANLSGILLNRVDMRRGGNFGYDYANYYYYQSGNSQTAPSGKLASLLQRFKLL